MRAHVLTLAVVLSSSACGDDILPPPPANLRVSAPTTGLDHDTNGYIIRTGEAVPGIVRPNQSASLSLEPGIHTVRLDGIAPNCTLQGPEAVEVTIVLGQVAQVTFQLQCAAVTGAIEVAAPTAGRDAPARGYTVRVNGDAGFTRSATVFPGGSVTIEGVPPGAQEVSLVNLGANCEVVGSDTRTVSVTAGGLTRDTVGTAFEVVCQAVTGDVRMSTATTGEDRDPDGYTVLFDGELIVFPGSFYYYGYTLRLRLEPNGSTLLLSIVPGNHTYQLADVAPNCTVSGANPRPVSVAVGATLDVLFEVVCTNVP